MMFLEIRFVLANYWLFFGYIMKNCTQIWKQKQWNWKSYESTQIPDFEIPWRHHCPFPETGSKHNSNQHPKTWPKGMKQAPFIEIIFPVFVEPQKCPSISIPKKLDFQPKKQISGRTFPAKKFWSPHLWATLFIIWFLQLESRKQNKSQSWEVLPQEFFMGWWTTSFTIFLNKGLSSTRNHHFANGGLFPGQWWS